MNRNLFSFFCKEPYRVFFPLGVLIGIVGVSHWLFYGLGWIKSYSMIFHSSIQIQAYLTCFIVGFLLTSIPRFSGTRTTTPVELLIFLLLFTGICFFNFRSLFPYAQLSFTGVLLWLMRFIFIRFRNKTISSLPPIEFVWIPIAILHGIAGTLCFVFASFGVLPAWLGIAGKLMSEQGFLLSIVLGVGGFLGSRLMGISQLILPPKGTSTEKLSEARNFRKKVILLHGLIFFISFFLEAGNHQFWAYGIRAVVITSELLWSGIIRFRPQVKDFYVTLLWLSFWMIAIGNWGVFLFPRFRVAMLHFVFIGGYSLMTFSVASMVILSHAGEVARLHHKLLILRIIAASILTAVLVRFAAVFLPNFYFSMLAWASIFWIGGGVSWFFFSLPLVFKVPVGDEFEEMHKAAKERISCN